MTHIDDLSRLAQTALKNEPMKNHTWFKIGGPADLILFPESETELQAICQLARKQNTPLYILGDGANVLVADEGIRGAVVFTNKMNKIQMAGTTITAQAGAKLSAVAAFACENALAGMEFTSGIPGTVGGVICMNAGAYNHDIEELISTVTLYADGKTITKTREEMGFAYRTSIVQNSDMLVLSATFQLTPGETMAIRETMQTLNAKRKASQPLEYYSAGSFFKRPPNNYAGKLIEDAGLKGFNINDAWVSEKHAGFVVNKGNATAKDVLALMRHVQTTVHEKFGVMLEPEVQILGV